MGKAISFSLVALFVAACLALVVDCSVAPAEWRRGVVNDKIYQPVTVHTSTNSDGKGGVTVHTHTEGPYYWIVVSCDGNTGRIAVNSWDYDRWQTHDNCQVEFRGGHFLTYSFLAIRRTDVEPR